MSGKVWLAIAICALGVLGASRGAWAQDKSADASEVENVSATPKPLDRGDNAWILTSSALVLMMTGPGLAMFYGGLVRRKNVLSVIMQCVFLMGLMSVIWALWGYSLAFGGGANPWIGNDEYLFMKGVQAHWDSETQQAVIPQHTLFNIPMLTHMLFQGMFFVITPALICGAFAERMKFSTMVVFMILWGTLVYCPIAHWVWGNGILAYGTEPAVKYTHGGALDFAGGTVVHISSGISALDLAPVDRPALGLRHRAHAAAQPDLHRAAAPPCCGSAGLASMPAAPWRPTAWRPAPSRPRTFRPPPARWPGPPWNG